LLSFKYGIGRCFLVAQVGSQFLTCLRQRWYLALRACWNFVGQFFFGFVYGVVGSIGFAFVMAESAV
jgi:hypothetical protein